MISMARFPGFRVPCGGLFPLGFRGESGPGKAGERLGLVEADVDHRVGSTQWFRAERGDPLPLPESGPGRHGGRLV